jgi:hypothetical protein
MHPYTCVLDSVSHVCLGLLWVSHCRDAAPRHPAACKHYLRATPSSFVAQRPSQLRSELVGHKCAVVMECVQQVS